MALTIEERPRAWSAGQLQTSPNASAPCAPQETGALVTPAFEPAPGANLASSTDRLPFALANRRNGVRPGPLYFATKRVLDVTLTLCLLTVLAPLLVLIALAIWVEDRGPMLYYQTRMGRNGVPFRFFKFRSMVRNADALKERLIRDGGNEAGEVIFKMKHDPRVTRAGRLLRKYSLDELPQFLNVLKGDMSLVGPRPHLPREVDAYREPGYHARNSVPPGLLCLREVQGRSNLTFEQWIALDLLYIEHQSMRTDLWILMRALPAVLKAEGAY